MKEVTKYNDLIKDYKDLYHKRVCKGFDDMHEMFKKYEGEVPKEVLDVFYSWFGDCDRCSNALEWGFVTDGWIDRDEGVIGENRIDLKKMEEYSRAIDEMAWYGRGDMLKLAKMAKKLGRNYTDDIADRKLALIEAEESTEAVKPPRRYGGACR